jgi:predicted nucleotidyltransferase
MSVLSYLNQKANEAVLAEKEKESINISISTLQKRFYNFLKREMIGIKNHFMFGSYTRGTILPRYMDENSDIDYMIIFNDTSYKPQTYINWLKKFVENYYPTSEIFQSSPAIVLELNHIKFDLVPANIKEGLFFEELYIPNNSGGWQITNPTRFNAELTEKNRNNSNLIKPAIRLVKYWNAENDYIFESFQLEKAIVNHSFFPLFVNYNLKIYFFEIIKSLYNYNLSDTNKKKVSRAIVIVKEIETCERRKDYDKAEDYIKRLIP